MKAYVIIENRKTGWIFGSTETGKKWRMLYQRVPKFEINEYGNNVQSKGSWAIKKGPLETNQKFMGKYSNTERFTIRNLTIEDFEIFIAEHFDEFL